MSLHLQVGAVGISSRAVQVVVLLDQFLQLQQDTATTLESLLYILSYTYNMLCIMYSMYYMYIHVHVHVCGPLQGSQERCPSKCGVLISDICSGW